jgi:hypothetical protein
MHQIILNEYEALKKELELLRNSPLLEKLNKLIDLLYEEKYGLYMHDYTDDMTEIILKNHEVMTQMSVIHYNQGEIVLVPFPFSDLSSVK